MQPAQYFNLPVMLLATALLASGFGMAAAAQDAAPETPTELKDFRLDTPPVREKAPQPSPPPEASPQPEAKTEAPQPKRAVPRSAAEAPSRQQRPSESDAPATEPLPSAGASEPQPEPVLETSPEAEAPVRAEPTQSKAEGAKLPSLLLGLWPVLAALMALLAGWMAFRWFSNRQPDALEGVSAVITTPAAPAIPTPTAKSAVPPKVASTSKLTASFEPSDARLSLANLTITGCLRLRYDGAAALPSLRLRNLVISASEGQRAFIDSFHSDPKAGQIDTLGGVQPGEEIVLTLELQVPRDALQAFDWRERRFVAPILLLNLSCDDPSVAPCRINCLVGQQGDPTSPRMRPLPIDRGPRHFAALRFSPIAA